MITEDYVSFETAKLLKEKGFEYNPDESYWLIDADNKIYWISRIGAYDYVDAPTESFQRPKNGYRLMTQAMAMKWLREKHNIAIETEWEHLWYAYVKPMTSKPSEEDCYQCKSPKYEEACEEAIKYCLENLI